MDWTTECPYCRQVVMIKIEENWNEEQIRKEAIMRCTCEEAKHEQDIMDSINMAEMYIREEYAAPDIVKTLFKGYTDDVGHGRIEKIGISMDKTKYSMAHKTKGGIKVDKITTIKEAKET
ncbi:MAG: hypothetical protein J6T99_07030 [Oscillospiraceae bacterium]|nr:hypothetical protein [Oscillospiraceae bacterium]